MWRQGVNRQEVIMKKKVIIYFDAFTVESISLSFVAIVLRSTDV